MRSKRMRQGNGSWFTFGDMWPTLTGGMPPPNSAPIAPQAVDRTLLLQYTPGVSAPGPEIGTGNLVTTGVEVVSGKLRVDVMSAPSVVAPSTVCSIVVAFSIITWDTALPGWEETNAPDPAQASRPWLYLQSRGILLPGTSATSPTTPYWRDPSGTFTINVPRLRIEAGMALELQIWNMAPTGGITIAAFLNGRLKVRDLE